MKIQVQFVVDVDIDPANPFTLTGSDVAKIVKQSVIRTLVINGLQTEANPEITLRPDIDVSAQWLI